MARHSILPDSSQIRHSRPAGVGRFGPVLSTALLVGLIGAGTAALNLRADAVPGATPSLPLPVETQPLTLQPSYQVRDHFAGRIEAARTTQPAFERSGLVIEVLVDEGADVAAGQIMARLDTATLEVRREALAAQRDQAQAELALAERTLRRQGQLSAQGFSSGQRFDEARFGKAALAAQINAIDAQIKAVEIDIDKSELKAPFSGTVGRRMVDEGTVVAAGSPLVELFEHGRIHARIGVSPEAARHLEIGHSYQLKTADRSLAGILAAIRPDLETGTRTVTALFTLEDGHTPLASGDLVHLALTSDIEGSGAWIPLHALKEADRGLWSVYTVVERDATPIVARETVEILHVDGDSAYVRGTFAPDAVLIMSGTNRIVPGQIVSPIGG